MRKTARWLLALPVAALGLGLAVLVAAAVAKTFTLGVANDAAVTNTKGVTTPEEIAAVRGLAVYTLSGDSKKHPECTARNGCFTFWPPVTVSSTKHLTRASGIAGTLSAWRRDGFNQLMWDGRPLYFYSGDGNHKDVAHGQGIATFGGVWHVVTLKVLGASTTTSHERIVDSHDHDADHDHHDPADHHHHAVLPVALPRVVEGRGPASSASPRPAGWGSLSGCPRPAAGRLSGD